MANIEIRLPSDFSLTGESKDDLLTTVKRVEFLDGKVLLYVDEVRGLKASEGTSKCFFVIDL